MKGRKRKGVLSAEDKDVNQPTMTQFFRPSATSPSQGVSLKKRRTDASTSSPDASSGKENRRSISKMPALVGALEEPSPRNKAPSSQPALATSFSSALRTKVVPQNGSVSLGTNSLRKVSRNFNSNRGGVLNDAAQFGAIIQTFEDDEVMDNDPKNFEALLGGSVTIRSPSQNKVPPSREHVTTLGALSEYREGSDAERGLGFRYRKGGDKDLPAGVQQFTHITPQLYSKMKDKEFASLPAEHSPELKTELLLPSVKLTDEQKNVLDIVLDGVSLFFTGSAGTGNSFLLREIVNQLRTRHRRNEVYVTASTGVAACSIGGCTVHAFAGLGLAKGSSELLAAKVMNQKWNSMKWKQAKVLIIDEVSMLEAEFFDKIEYVARKVRDCDKPFGGLQVVLCGDFLQLPPVSKGSGKQFCFDAECWKKVVTKTILLTQVFRQSDPAFVSLLNEVRLGRLSQKTQQILQGCMKADEADQEDDDGGIEPTRLFSLLRDVESENERRLDALPGSRHFFLAEDDGVNPFLGQLQKSCSAPENLVLKLDAQVILLKNLDFEEELFNGARGRVVGFKKPFMCENKTWASMEWPEVLFTSGTTRVLTPEVWQVEVGGDVKASRKQVPLSLAWALSIHKSQGMTISRVEMRLANVFEYGQAYVALSRATSLKGLRIVDFNPRGIKAHPRVLQYYSSVCGKQKWAEMLQQQQQEEEGEGSSVNDGGKEKEKKAGGYGEDIPDELFNELFDVMQEKGGWGVAATATSSKEKEEEGKEEKEEKEEEKEEAKDEVVIILDSNDDERRTTDNREEEEDEEEGGGFIPSDS